MRAWMALLAVIPACGFHSSPSSGGDDDGTPDASYCYGTFVPVCFPTAPAATISLTGTDIDTDTSSMCDRSNDQVDRYCVIAAASFTLTTGAKLRAHGNKPLVLLSATTMFDLSGEIDVSSSVAGSKGAGGDPQGECTNGTTAATMNSGGYGGSFESKGGDGKQSDGASGIAGGVLTQFPSVLRGGCPGGTGAGTNGGVGGSGGGAVVIIAMDIRLNGSINASGSGGHGGGASKCGGGGGGSGGMIVLDSTSINVSVGPNLLFANGGGGGQGGEMKVSGEGAPGGESTAPTSVPIGGNNGSTNGGGGGNGAFGITNKDGDPAVGTVGSNAGGGGGGGGAGFIHAAVISGAIIAPPSRSIP